MQFWEITLTIRITEIRNRLDTCPYSYSLSLSWLVVQIIFTLISFQGTFRYHSTAWRNTATVTKRRETMHPGYWLSPFTKICVQLRFNATKTTLVLNHTAPSLHSVLQQGSNQAMTQVLFSETVFPLIPTTLDNFCLEKGLNVIVSYNTRIVKARIGLFLNKTRCPYLSPYFARGVGFDLSMGFPHNITCGDVYLDDDDDDDNGPRVTPAFCKIYIQ